MFYKEYKTILSKENVMNIYRGCNHGCIYCDSRSACYNINHEFDNIEVKKDAYKILDYELYNKKKKVMVWTGSMSDPYNIVEKEIEYTRKCLEVIKKHECGVVILTKSNLILRDLDLIKEINMKSKAVVEMTLTTFDDNLCKIIEPNVSLTSERIEVLKRCHEEGIPTIVWFTPFLPYINDTKENLLSLIDACEKAHVKGIIYFGMGVTLREGDREYFYSKLDEHFKGLKEKYILEFKNKYEAKRYESKYLDNIFYEECKKRNIMSNVDEIFSYMKEYPEKNKQLSLFDI